MSGIYGIFNRDGAPVAPQVMQRMRAGFADWVVDREDSCGLVEVSLGHIMLHTTPESLYEQLPSSHRDHPDLFITADARIDNRADLCADLAIEPAERQNIADSTLILLAYAKWRESCAARLIGDFAFVIWDKRRRLLYCARDHIGLKPFYYYLTTNRFVFASDQRALLAHPATPRKLNEPLLALYLQEYSFYAEQTLTFFEQLVKLPPAHWLSVTADQMRLEKYWSPEGVPELKLAGDSDYEERLRELLDRVVSDRLRSAFPLGAHLSGGLDSTTIAVMAARGLRAQGRKLTSAFSWSPPAGPGAESDERRVIAEVCALEDIKCQYLTWGVEHGLEVFRMNFTIQPQEMLLRELIVQRQVQQQQIRVLLSGWGGDETITNHGRGYLAELLVRGKWRTLINEIDAAIRGNRRDKLHMLKRYGGLVYRRILPLLVADTFLKMAQQLHSDTLSAGYINKAFAQRYAKEVAQLRGPLLREHRGIHRSQKNHLLSGHLTERLESWAISGALHGIEYRYPLLDRRVIEFALAVPSSQLYRNGWGRYLFRRAVGGIVPDSVRWNRSKTELAAVSRVIDVLPAMLPPLFAELDNPVSRERVAAYIDVTKLEKALREDKPLSGEWILLARAISCYQIW